MTVDEWVERVEEDGEWVIYVMDHNTTGAFGPAKVAVLLTDGGILSPCPTQDCTTEQGI